MRATRRRQRRRRSKSRKQKGGAVKLPQFAPFAWPAEFGCSATKQEIVTLHAGSKGDRIGLIGPYADFIALYGEDKDGNPTPIAYSDRSIALVGPEKIPYINTNGEEKNLRKNIYEKLTSDQTDNEHTLSHEIIIKEDIQHVLLCPVEPYFGFHPVDKAGYQAKLPLPLLELERQRVIEIQPVSAPKWADKLSTNLPARQTTFYTKTGDVKSIASDGTVTVERLDGTKYTLFRGQVTELDIHL
jgi:hypothetical protein